MLRGGWEDRLDRLLAELAIHRLADHPMPPGMEVKCYSHPLGEYGVAFFAAPDLASHLSGGFPELLDAAPLLAPGEDSALHATSSIPPCGRSVRAHAGACLR